MSKKQYTSRFKRGSNPMVLTSRDLEILKAISDYRFLTTTQVTRFFFGFRTKAVRRMRQLFDNKFVNRVFRTVLMGSPEIVYCLDQRGADVLIERTGMDREKINWYPKSREVRQYFLKHVLRINDFRIKLEEAAKQNSYQILSWRNEKELKTRIGNRLVSEKVRDPASKAGKRIPLTPDGHFVLSTAKGKGSFFLEIDMATESQQIMKQKFHAYVMYLLEGAYEKQFSSRIFRILTITTSQKRLENMVKTAAAALEIFRDPKYSKMFWFTTFDRIGKEGVLAGWTVPGMGGTLLKID